MEFNFNMPTNLYFGRDCINENRQLFSSYGKKALIVTGRKSAKLNGSLKDVCSALDSADIPYAVFDRVEANPSVETVREAASMSRKEEADFIIGIGGGSPLDAAKAIAVLAVNDLEDDEIFATSWPVRPLPVVAVPTTAGTGSEATQYSILTYNKIENKKSIASELIFPVASYLDGRYTGTLSRTTTINTAVDALSHSVEGYLSLRATEIIRPLALESIAILGNSLKTLLADKPVSDDERDNLLYASMLAGMVIAHTGTTAVHAMGYPLTYFRDVDHGRANGLLMYGYLKFLEKDPKVGEILSAMKLKDLEEFRDMADTLFGEKERFTDEEIEKFVETAMTGKNIAGTEPHPDRDDVRKIYRDSFMQH